MSSYAPDEPRSFKEERESKQINILLMFRWNFLQPQFVSLQVVRQNTSHSTNTPVTAAYVTLSWASTIVSVHQTQGWGHSNPGKKQVNTASSYTLRTCVQ